MYVKAYEISIVKKNELNVFIYRDFINDETVIYLYLVSDLSLDTKS